MIPAGTWHGLPSYLEVLPLNQAFAGFPEYRTIEVPYYGDSVIVEAAPERHLSPALPDTIVGLFRVYPPDVQPPPVANHWDGIGGGGMTVTAPPQWEGYHHHIPDHEEGHQAIIELLEKHSKPSTWEGRG